MCIIYIWIMGPTCPNHTWKTTSAISSNQICLFNHQEAKLIILDKQHLYFKIAFSTATIALMELHPRTDIYIYILYTIIYISNIRITSYILSINPAICQALLKESLGGWTINPPPPPDRPRNPKKCKTSTVLKACSQTLGNCLFPNLRELIVPKP